MHQGTFPALSLPVSKPAAADYRRGAWGRGELDAATAAPPTRRQWLAGVGGLVAGAALATGWAALGHTPVGAASPADRAAILPGTPEWALELLEAPADAVIRWSGDLERVVARHSGDLRLVPCCERVLEIVLDERRAMAHPEQIDTAGACAVRALDRLGRPDLVTTRSRRILSRRDLAQTNAAAERLMDPGRRAPEARK